MDDLQFLQEIGDEICEGCGPDRDCGLEYDECFRIDNALECLKKYLKERNMIYENKRFNKTTAKKETELS